MHPSDELMKVPPSPIPPGEFDQINSITIKQCELCDEAVSNLERRLGLILSEACPVPRQPNADINVSCTLSEKLADHLESLIQVTCRIESITNSINI